jgi:hypothetical protein
MEPKIEAMGTLEMNPKELYKGEFLSKREVRPGAAPGALVSWC